MGRVREYIGAGVVNNPDPARKEPSWGSAFPWEDTMRHGRSEKKVGAYCNTPLRGVLILCAVLAFLPSCGGGGGGIDAPAEPISRDRHGVHVSPVELWRVADRYDFTYPTEADFDRIAALGKYVVINPNTAFLKSVEIGDAALEAIDLAYSRNLFSIVRLDYNRSVRDGTNPNPTPTNQYWFEHEWAPYVNRVVNYGLTRRVWAYQICNEVFEESHPMVGPTGADITPEEYVDLLGNTAELIKSIDPNVYILNAGITSPVEDRYYPIAVRLLNAGMERWIDYTNWHYYTRGIDDDERSRIMHLRALSELPWVITEANHIDPGVPPERKWNIIKSIYREMAPELICSFIWQGDDANSPKWTIKDTGLEELILEEWNRGPQAP